MGASDHRHTQAAGPVSEALRLKAPTAAAPRARSLFLSEVVNSPSDSEGTEFFEAHEEMPWTPDRPMRRSPATMAASRMDLLLWPENDISSITYPGSTKEPLELGSPPVVRTEDKPADSGQNVGTLEDDTRERSRVPVAVRRALASVAACCCRCENFSLAVSNRTRRNSTDRSALCFVF